jgi:hypothetical protein
MAVKDTTPVIGWAGLSIILGVILFSVLAYNANSFFANRYSHEWGFMNNKETKSVGENLCQEKGFERVYETKLIKDSYYSVTCMRIIEDKFEMKDFQIWKKQMEV